MKVDQTNLCQDDTGIEGRIVISNYNKSFWGAFLQKGSKSKTYYKKRSKKTTRQIGR